MLLSITAAALVIACTSKSALIAQGPEPPNLPTENTARFAVCAIPDQHNFLSVLFDAGLSTGPTPPLRYEWDWNSNGTVDTVTSEYIVAPGNVWGYLEGRDSVTVTLRVVYADQSTATATRNIDSAALRLSYEPQQDGPEPPR